ncbi:methylamine dehydrogenase light chain [Kineococcus auxinigenes]|uniref:methylamine dehydrogenase light chain n=1 Tax=unclassified Kineococcus TaxID=2621656 RepID=UPI003D7D6E4F
MPNPDETHEKQFAVDERTVQEQADWLAGQGGSRTSRVTRRLSERVSRRSALSKLGAWTMGLTGVAMIGALPVTRSAQAAPGAPAAPGTEPLLPVYEGSNPAECEYWRWCNMDGRPCSSCTGGGVTTCAPGSKPGAEFWVGCCTEPTTGKTYLIAYYDCCGASSCSTNYCGEPDAQAVMYNPVSGSYDQEIIWCVSDESQSYTCTMAPIIGEDCTPRPAARPKVGAGA